MSSRTFSSTTSLLGERGREGKEKRGERKGKRKREEEVRQPWYFASA